MREYICDKIVCVPNEPPKQTWKLFFGDTGHIIRVDKVDYKVFQNLYEKAMADFWTFKVVDFSQDATGWERLDENAKRMFLLNNGYQTLMDSGVYNEYFSLLRFVSNSELSILYSMIGMQEATQHAPGYSYGLSQMFGGNVEKQFNVVYEDSFVKRRLNSEVDFAYKLQIKSQDGKIDDELKKLILQVIFATYYLESVKFPFSFMVTWKINEAYDYAIQGFSQIIALIAYDELTTHKPTNKNVLNILLKEEKQGFKHLKDWFIEWAISYVKEQVLEELEWNKYLHSEGSINGFTEDLGELVIKYFADDCLKLIGIDGIYNVEEFSDLSWYKKQYDINSTNNANQELSNISYQRGGVKNDLNKFDNFK